MGLSGELKEGFRVTGNPVITDVVAVPSVIFGFVQEILFLLHSSQSGQEIFSLRRALLLLIFILRNRGIEGSVGILIGFRRPMETSGWMSQDPELTVMRAEVNKQSVSGASSKSRTSPKCHPHPHKISGRKYFSLISDS